MLVHAVAHAHIGDRERGRSCAEALEHGTARTVSYRWGCAGIGGIERRLVFSLQLRRDPARDRSLRRGDGCLNDSFLGRELV